MKRCLIGEATKKIGQKVLIKAWVDTKRTHGKIVFLDLRDRTGILQCIAVPEISSDLREEFVVEVQGKIKERPLQMQNKNLKTGAVELEAEKVKILAESENLPFEIKEGINLSLPVALDFRALTLRNEKTKAIFKVKEEVIKAFRQTMTKQGFAEFQAPTIVPTATEGGAEVFKLDYYGRPAFLAQSPQLYKQIMVGVFERVFTLDHAYRAEPSVTTRHISEYISLDVEMGFIESWKDLMAMSEKLLKDIFKAVQNNCRKELEMLAVELPKMPKKIPQVTMREAQEIIFQRTKRDQRKEVDLDPEDEKEICLWAKEKYNSDLLFVTHYPTKKRPFYSFPDPKNPDYTLSFDILCSGLEIVTGGQRINNYGQLLENIKKWGNKPEDFELYLQAFKYGMPPEGGFALGAERVVKQMLRLQNLREANLFPRDMGRIDKRLI